MPRPYFTAFLMLLVIFALLLSSGQVRAMDLYSYDLDSLVYLSTEVVDANVVSVQTEGGLDITRVKVTHVYLGHFHVGDTVKVTALDFFRVGGQIPGTLVRSAGRRGIEAGDSATFFLAKAKSVFLYDIPKDADIYWPAPSGVKMLDQGRIKGFEQYENPGPYGLEWTDAETLKLLPTPAQFRGQLANSIQTVEPLRLVLTKAVTAADKPALLAIIKQRKRTGSRWLGWGKRDAVSEAACDQIVSLHDLNAVADALAITESRNLARAFDNLQGADFLIKIIGDPVQPFARRLGCAKAVGAAFSPLDPKAGSAYLSRLIALCAVVQHTPALTEEVLNGLDALAQPTYGGSADIVPHPVSAPVTAGLKTLREIHASAALVQVRFAVEKLVWKAAGSAAYRTLRSPCGPVLSLVQPPDDLPANLPSSAGKLTYQSSIRWADPSWREARDLKTALVLVDAGTGVRTTVPPGRELYGSDSMEDREMTLQADLPQSLPHGRYHVFLEFSRPHHPVSTGYGYEADL